MCGIAGFFQTKFNITENANIYNSFRNKLLKMKESIKHRGPDDDDIFIDRYVGFAHTRLSIRDINCGHQPMTGHYQNRTATIIYNGELYNSAELISRLSTYNIEWKTTSDTEVILYTYLVFGTTAFKEINGIFTFAIYENDNLIIARDHVGVKPLFYQLTDNQFIFSSEPKGIFAYGIKPAINDESWCEIIGLGPARTPGKGVFKNMHELLPGHFIKVHSDCAGMLILKESTFWKLTSHCHKESYNTTVDHTSYLIKDSIKRQMISDIPICSFLSGGLDSSLVSAISQSELKKENAVLNTFSFDFKNNNTNFVANDFQSSQDYPFVKTMVEHIGSNHTYLECDNEEQISGLYKAVDARDLPCMADVESSLLYFCGIVSKSCRVALTGEYADEIFGGYPWFHKPEMLYQNTFPWSYDMSARTALFRDDFISKLNIDEYVNNAYTTSVNQCPYLDTDSKEEHHRRKTSWINIQWFMMTLLNRMDRTSMYSGLEARVPFADYRILEYVFNIPWKYKFHNGVAKSLLVECGKEFLPDDILYRKKSPYPKTYDPKYEMLLSKQLLNEIKNNYALKYIVDVNKLNSFISSPTNYKKPWYGQLMAGPQMLAYILQISYWMKKYELLN